jgi:hypothetical protein
VKIARVFPLVTPAVDVTESVTLTVLDSEVFPEYLNVPLAFPCEKEPDNRTCDEPEDLMDRFDDVDDVETPAIRPNVPRLSPE